MANRDRWCPNCQQMVRPKVQVRTLIILVFFVLSAIWYHPRAPAFLHGFNR